MDKETRLKTEVGLWIDHREAIIVTLTGEAEQITHIRPEGSEGPHRPKEFTAEDVRDRKFENVLNEFYDDVVAAVRDAEAIQIFGPGEAKGELEKRLERAGLKEHVLATEAADKMTERQIAAKVRKRFQG